MKRIIHVVPDLSLLPPEVVKYVRFNEIPRKTTDLNLMIDFTASYGGYRDGKNAAQDIIYKKHPQSVILHKEGIQASVYVPETTQVICKIDATSRGFRRDLKDCLDDYRTDAILIDSWEKVAGEIKNTDIDLNIGKPVYLFETRGDVFGLLTFASQLDMCRGVISSAATNYANHGVVLTPLPMANFMLPLPDTSTWGEEESYRIIRIYNQACMECWIDGLQAPNFGKFLKGEF